LRYEECLQNWGNATTQYAIKLTAKARWQIRQDTLHHPALKFWVKHLGQLNELFGAVYTVGLKALFVELG
jgi:hypothetical protein